MCDYSLQHVASRPAKVGRYPRLDPVRELDHPRVRGAGESRTSPCAFFPVPSWCSTATSSAIIPSGFSQTRSCGKTWRASDRSTWNNPWEHHDALEFPSGRVIC